MYIDYSFLEHVEIYHFACKLYIKSSEHLQNLSYEIKNYKKKSFQRSKEFSQKHTQLLIFFTRSIKKAESFRIIWLISRKPETQIENFSNKNWKIQT